LGGIPSKAKLQNLSPNILQEFSKDILDLHPVAVGVLSTTQLTQSLKLPTFELFQKLGT
jgi:hypothetical protein